MVIDLFDAINEGTYYGLTVTKNADRTITVSGELDREYGQLTALIPIHLPNGAVLKRVDDNATGIGFQLKYYEIGSETALYTNLSTERTIDYDTYENYQLYIQAVRGFFISPVTFTPLVRSSKGLCSNYRAMVRRRDLLLAKKDQLVLYDHGDEKIAITGGWKTMIASQWSTSQVAMTKESDHLHINCTTHGSHYAGFQIRNQVDISAYTKLCALIQFDSQTGADDCVLYSVWYDTQIDNISDLPGGGWEWSAIKLMTYDGADMIVRANEPSKRIVINPPDKCEGEKSTAKGNMIRVGIDMAYCRTGSLVDIYKVWLE